MLLEKIIEQFDAAKIPVMLLKGQGIAVLANGNSMWWLLRYIVYWSLMPAAQVSWLDLFDPGIREADEAMTGAPRFRKLLTTKVRIVGVMALAVLMCAVVAWPWIDRAPESAVDNVPVKPGGK